MERLRAKLKSESGASITFALLIFLVCAVLSAVIIVAASVSAGRMSSFTEKGKIGSLSKSENNYYAVTSAAELIIDLMIGESKNEPISIITVKNRYGEIIEGPLFCKETASQIENKYITYEPMISESGYDEGITIKDYNFGSLPAITSNSDLAAFTVNNIPPEGSVIEKKFSLSAQTGGSGIASLSTEVNETVYGNGSIRFSITSKEKPSITMSLMFDPEVFDKRIDSMNNGVLEERTIEITTVKWNLTSVE